MQVVNSITFDKKFFKLIEQETVLSFKRCWVCGKIKPLSEFYRDKSRSGGYDNKCIECTRKKKAERRWQRNGKSQS